MATTYLIDCSAGGDEDYSSQFAAEAFLDNSTLTDDIILDCYASTPGDDDTTAVTWDLNHDSNTYTVTIKSKAGSGLEDLGDWPTEYLCLGQAYRMNCSAACITIRSGPFKIQGIELQTTGTYGVHFDDGDLGSGTEVTNCYIHGTSTAGIYVGDQCNEAVTVELCRNRIWNSAGAGILIGGANQTTNCRHNTIFGCGTYGINRTAGTANAYNNRVGNCRTACYNGTFGTKTNNVSSDATGDTGKTSIGMNVGIKAALIGDTDTHLEETGQVYHKSTIAGGEYDRSSGLPHGISGDTGDISFVTGASPPGGQTYVMQIDYDSEVGFASMFAGNGQTDIWGAITFRLTSTGGMTNGDFQGIFALVEEGEPYTPCFEIYIHKDWGFSGFQLIDDEGNGTGDETVAGGDWVTIKFHYIAGTSCVWRYRIGSGSWTAGGTTTPGATDYVQSLYFGIGSGQTASSGSLQIAKWQMSIADPSDSEAEDTYDDYGSSTNTQYTGTDQTATPAGSTDLDGDTVDSYDCGADERDWSGASTSTTTTSSTTSTTSSTTSSTSSSTTTTVSTSSSTTSSSTTSSTTTLSTSSSTTSSSTTSSSTTTLSTSSSTTSSTTSSSTTTLSTSSSTTSSSTTSSSTTSTSSSTTSSSTTSSSTTSSSTSSTSSSTTSSSTSTTSSSTTSTSTSSTSTSSSSTTTSTTSTSSTSTSSSSTSTSSTSTSTTSSTTTTVSATTTTTSTTSTTLTYTYRYDIGFVEGQNTYATTSTVTTQPGFPYPFGVPRRAGLTNAIDELWGWPESETVSVVLPEPASSEMDPYSLKTYVTFGQGCAIFDGAGPNILDTGHAIRAWVSPAPQNTPSFSSTTSTTSTSTSSTTSSTTTTSSSTTSTSTTTTEP